MLSKYLKYKKVSSACSLFFFSFGFELECIIERAYNYHDGQVITQKGFAKTQDIKHPQACRYYLMVS